MQYDFLIVGSGLTGSVIARELHDVGHSVLVLERRSHLGGNVHDHAHVSGIRVHTYGPHYFRTNDEGLWNFVNRFSTFFKYEAVVKSLVDGALENWPISGSYIHDHIGSGWRPDFTGVPTNFEEASLTMMPRKIYEKFVKGYTEKQWGVSASTLDVALAKRFDVRIDDEPRLMTHKYQGIPTNGYSAFMSNMLGGIPVMVNVDYLRYKTTFNNHAFLIFTGPIDEFFGFDLGKLQYRGQKREHEYIPDVDFLQPCGQVNNPQSESGPHIRTLEWKHMMDKTYAKAIKGTLLTREITITPGDSDNYEYPFPSELNRRLYERYRERADQLSNVFICGRLGEYRYLDMDQAIARARMHAKNILNRFYVRK